MLDAVGAHHTLTLSSTITPLAQVDDPSRVFVLVALGFHVEFTLPEAISFADVKQTSLTGALSKLKDREAEVARDIVSAESMIRDLRALA